MNTTLDQLLTNVYELEGLLLVMQRHNDSIPQLVIDRFKEKAIEIAAVANVLEAHQKHEDSPQVVPPAFVPPASEHTEVAQQVPSEKPDSAPTVPATSSVVPPPASDLIVEPVPDTDKEECSKPVKDNKPIEQPKVTLNHEPSSAHDITSAFSINDRFLFQRELFDGNKQKYDDAIAVMQRLADIDKIKEFITDILGLDRSNEVVKEFVRLIELSFKG